MEYDSFRHNDALSSRSHHIHIYFLKICVLYCLLEILLFNFVHEKVKMVCFLSLHQIGLCIILLLFWHNNQDSDEVTWHAWSFAINHKSQTSYIGIWAVQFRQRGRFEHPLSLAKRLPAALIWSCYAAGQWMGAAGQLPPSIRSVCGSNTVN